MHTTEDIIAAHTVESLGHAITVDAVREDDDSASLSSTIDGFAWRDWIEATPENDTPIAVQCEREAIRLAEAIRYGGVLFRDGKPVDGRTVDWSDDDDDVIAGRVRERADELRLDAAMEERKDDERAWFVGRMQTERSDSKKII